MTELVRLSGLEVHFPIRSGIGDTVARRASGAVRAVDGVDLTIERGEILALVGRVRLGQDDDRPRDREADAADRRDGHRSTARTSSRLWSTKRAARLPAARPADLPGPVRDARPEADDPRLRGRAAAGQQHRHVRRGSRSPGRRGARSRPGCGRRRTSPSATRTSCRADSASASSSRVRSSWGRSWWSRTSPSRCSTSRSARSCCGSCSTCATEREPDLPVHHPRPVAGLGASRTGSR